MKKLVLLMSILLFSGCMLQRQSGAQGIAGTVRWVEGNLMPAIGDSTYIERSKGAPIQREIYIYKAIKIHDAEPKQGVFFQGIRSELIKKVTTDKDGKFKVILPPGKYSVFVMENEGLFANKYDGENYINPVTVNSGSFTEVEILINYKAYY